jgi:hypothetical protein
LEAARLLRSITKGGFFMAISGIGNGYGYGSGYGYGYNSSYNNYGSYGVSNRKIPTDPDDQVKAGRRSSPDDCETCKNRKYQDGSNESDVSFKAPGHISPQASSGTVRAHEQQHVSNAYQKAATENGKVRAATVSIQTAVCPECGTSYVSGGETRTTIVSSQPNPYQQNQKSLDAMNSVGTNIDAIA